MKKIGGNKDLELQIKTVTENDDGEQLESWSTVDTLTGFLDLSNGDSKYTSYNAKTQESTHYFICDYKESVESVNAENGRILDPKNNKIYEILLIDNPMELSYHLEFYLKYTGGQ